MGLIHIHEVDGGFKVETFGRDGKEYLRNAVSEVNTLVSKLLSGCEAQNTFKAAVIRIFNKSHPFTCCFCEKRLSRDEIYPCGKVVACKCCYDEGEGK